MLLVPDEQQILERAEKAYTFWERRTHALLLALAHAGIMTVDELRRGIEALPVEMQRKLSYYELWAASMAAILMERGVFSPAEFDQELGPVPPAVTHARFKAGDVVRVKDEARGPQWRRPHIRTPGYLHGLVGMVERDAQGLFGDPEALAFRRPAPKQPLYRVQFAQADVWEGYSGPEQDTLDVEVYEPWLEQATQQDLDAQRAARRARQAVFHAHAGGHGQDATRECLTAVHAQNHDHAHDHDHHHDHGHDHGHSHVHSHGEGEPHVHEARGAVEAAAVDKEDPEEGERRRVSDALVRLVTSKGLVTAEQLRAGVERIDQWGAQGQGPRLVVRAWLDPAFKARLLQDAGAAAAELGISASAYPSSAPAAAPPGGGAGGGGGTAPAPAQLPARSGTILTAVENTPTQHNLVVCTLCSCYPLTILGLSPAWYKSRAYRARAVRDPRGLLQEFGTQLSDGTSVRVHDSTADNRYIVLPLRPEGTEGWSEEQLMRLVTRDSMIGVAQALPASSVQA